MNMAKRMHKYDLDFKADDIATLRIAREKASQEE